MEIRLPYGLTTISAEISRDVGVDVIELPPVEAANDPVAEVDRALTDPLGGFVWADHRSANSVAVSVAASCSAHCAKFPTLA